MKPQRDKDGLFKTHCLTCGATLWNAADAEPHINCEHCPGHDDIARVNQESADRHCKHPDIEWEEVDNLVLKGHRLFCRKPVSKYRKSEKDDAK